MRRQGSTAVVSLLDNPFELQAERERIAFMRQHGVDLGAAAGRLHLHDAEVEVVDHVAQRRADAEASENSSSMNVPTSGWVSSIWLMPDDVSETALPRGRTALTSKMQPMWMSPERNISSRPDAALRFTNAPRRLSSADPLLGAREPVRPLVARLVDVGDLEVAEVELEPVRRAIFAR